MRSLTSTFVFALALAARSAYAVTETVVQGVDTTSKIVTSVSETSTGVGTAAIKHLRVMAVTPLGTAIDVYSKGLTRTSSTVLCLSGATTTVLMADATGSRRRVDVQNPGTSVGFIRVGGTGTAAGVGTEVYPTGVWTDASSASAAVLVRNDTGAPITVQITVYL